MEIALKTYNLTMNKLVTDLNPPDLNNQINYN